MENKKHAFVVKHPIYSC